MTSLMLLRGIGVSLLGLIVGRRGGLLVRHDGRRLRRLVTGADVGPLVAVDADRLMLRCHRRAARRVARRRFCYHAVLEATAGDTTVAWRLNLKYRS